MALTLCTLVSTLSAGTAVAGKRAVTRKFDLRPTGKAVLQKANVTANPPKVLFFQVPSQSSSTPRRPVLTHAADDADLARSSLDSFSEALDSLDDEKDYDVITGQELREISEQKWGRAYDIRISQRRNQLNQLRLYVQVMWKFLGQKSFPMSEKKYMEQLDAVAELLTEWGVADQVRKDLLKTNKRPVVDTTGGNAVSIPLDVEA